MSSFKNLKFRKKLKAFPKRLEQVFFQVFNKARHIHFHYSCFYKKETASLYLKAKWYQGSPHCVPSRRLLSFKHIRADK